MQTRGTGYSQLPNELVMHVAGHIKDSRDMTNFASTSKNNYANTLQSFHLLPPGEQQKHLLSAIMNDNVDAVAFMLKAEPNQSGAIDASHHSVHNLYGKESVIWLASLQSKNANEFIKLLLKNTNTSPTVSIASNACKLGTPMSTSTALKFFERSFNADPANFKSQANDMMHLSAQSRDPGTLRALLMMPQLGLDTNSIQNGTSLLSKSLYSNNHNMLKFLVNETNIDPNIKDTSGNTPLHTAMIESVSDRVSIDTIKTLLSSNRINANISNNQGQTPLKMVVDYFIMLRKGRNDISINQTSKLTSALSLLLKSPGLNINEKDTATGNTALHRCADSGFESGVRLLASHPDININSKNFSGKRARDFASTPEIKKLLPKDGFFEKIKQTIR
nr:ankyrin repeat domain-containing protein [Pantoea sp. 201603H]